MENIKYSQEARKIKRRKDSADNRMSKMGYDIKDIDKSLQDFNDDISNMEDISKALDHRKEIIEKGEFIFSSGECGEKIKSIKLDVVNLQIKNLQKNLLFLRLNMRPATNSFRILKEHPLTPNFDEACNLQKRIFEMHKVHSCLKANEFFTQVLNAVFDMDKNFALKHEDKTQVYGKFSESFERATTKVEKKDEKVIQDVCKVFSAHFPEINFAFDNEIENN